MKKIVLSLLMVFAMISTSLFNVNAATKEKNQKIEYKPGSVVIIYNDPVDASNTTQVKDNLNQHTSKVHIKGVRGLSRNQKKAKVVEATVDPSTNIETAIKDIQQNPNVKVAQPNYIYHVLSTDQSTYATGETCNLTPGSDLGQDPLWAQELLGTTAAQNLVTSTTTQNVGIIDSGINGTQQYLTAHVNTAISANFVSYEADGSTFKGTTAWQDLNDHGTHVAGLVGGDNVGVATNHVSLVALRAMDANGSGSTADIYAAIDYAQSLNKDADTTNDIHILNMSLGSNYPDPTLYFVLNSFDGIVVAASGNSGNKYGPSYPAAFDLPNIISVGAMQYHGANGTNNYAPTAYSNYDTYSTDLFTYGGNASEQNITTDPYDGIYSSYAKNASGAAANDQCAYDAGTSMATPIVTGAVALMKGMNPNATDQQIYNTLIANVQKPATLANTSVSNGYLDLAASINGAAGAAGGDNTLYTLTLDANGGQIPFVVPDPSITPAPQDGQQITNYVNVTQMYYKLNSTYWLPYAQKTGYRFMGWSASPTATTPDTGWAVGDKLNTATQINTKMYAVWAKEYSLSFNANGGTGRMPVLQLIENQQISLPANNFTRNGFTFLGWNTDQTQAKLGVVQYGNRGTYKQTDTSNHVLYAVWKANNVMVYGTGNNTYVYGFNGNGVLGNGTTNYVQEGNAILLKSLLPATENIKQVVANRNNNIYVVTTAGNVYASGVNTYGQRGFNPVTNKFNKIDLMGAKISSLSVTNNLVKMRVGTSNNYFYVGYHSFNVNTHAFTQTNKYPVQVQYSNGNVVKAWNYNYAYHKLNAVYTYSGAKITSKTTYAYDTKGVMTKQIIYKYSNGLKTSRYEYDYVNGKLKSTATAKAARYNTTYKNGKALKTYRSYYSTTGALQAATVVATRA